MRTIKFRVWDKFRKKMINQENILSIHFDRRTGNPNLVSFTNNKNYHTGLEEADRGYANEIVFMQNTGLTDKNGKEVYEGDVVKFNDECGEWINKVVFERGLFGLGLSPKQIKNPTDWKEKHNKVESRWWSVEWGYEEFGKAFSYRKPLAQRTVYRGNISEYRESDDHKNQEKIGFEKYFIRNCEVIGNIYENPELLTTQ